MQAGILVESTGSEILITELPAIVSIFKIVSESKPKDKFLIWAKVSNDISNVGDSVDLVGALKNENRMKDITCIFKAKFTIVSPVWPGHN